MRNLRRRVQSLDEWFGLFVEIKSSQLVARSLQNYRSEWAQYAAFVCARQPAVDVTAASLQAYVDKLSCTRRPTGVATAWRNLRPFLNFLEERGVPTGVAAVRVPKVGREQKKPLTDEEVRRMMKCILNPRDKALLLLILDTGLRSREVRELTPGSLDMEGRTVWVGSGKGGKTRMVPFSPLVGRALAEWALVREPSCPWFFHNVDTNYGTQITTDHLNHIFNRLGKAAGVKDPVGPHRIRHTFGRLFVTGGGDPFSLQRVLGHSTLTTSMQYVNLNGGDLQKVHQRVSPAGTALFGESRGRKR